MLLLVMPFALLPMPVSMLLFQLSPLRRWRWALKKLAPEKATWLFLLIGVALCPAAANNLVAGQNAFLTAALLTGGFALLANTPRCWRGALLGLMLFKPQYFPLAGGGAAGDEILACAGRDDRHGVAGVAGQHGAVRRRSVAGLIGTFLHPQVIPGGINGNDWGHMWDSSVGDLRRCWARRTGLRPACKGGGADRGVAFGLARLPRPAGSLAGAAGRVCSAPACWHRRMSRPTT